MKFSTDCVFECVERSINMAFGVIVLPVFLWWFLDFLRWFNEKSTSTMAIYPNVFGIIPLVVFVSGLLFCMVFLLGMNPFLNGSNVSEQSITPHEG